MKITSKGQVTIPQEVRERHGFLPGTEVLFVDDGRQVRLVKATEERRRGRRLVAHMHGRADTRLSTDEIMALTRGDPVDALPLAPSSPRKA
jgi:AbrB family looped-hinge helix DNA binding protein